MKHNAAMKEMRSKVLDEISVKIRRQEHMIRFLKADLADYLANGRGLGNAQHRAQIAACQRRVTALLVIQTAVEDA